MHPLTPRLADNTAVKSLRVTNCRRTRSHRPGQCGKPRPCDQSPGATPKRSAHDLPDLRNMWRSATLTANRWDQVSARDVGSEKGAHESTAYGEGNEKESKRPEIQNRSHKLRCHDAAIHDLKKRVLQKCGRT